MSHSVDQHKLSVGDRQLVVSNLEKVLYPATGVNTTEFRKGQVLDYYAKIAPALLPHLAGRPLTRKRYPDGVEGPSFFEKNAPRGTPSWVRTVTLPVPGSTKGRDTIDFVIVDELATLVWAANLASLELHVPQWRVDAGGAVLDPDLLVFDLDPGAPASIVECCQVALLLREILADSGATAYPKTSGSKGLHLYVPIRPTPSDQTRDYARSLAKQLERERPELVISEMARERRPGKVFVDWSQNAAAKTTVAPYSLRARPTPSVSTPISWDDVESCRSPDDLVFLADDVVKRVERDGDVLADLVLLPPSKRAGLPQGRKRGGAR